MKSVSIYLKPQAWTTTLDVFCLDVLIVFSNFTRWSVAFPTLIFLSFCRQSKKPRFMCLHTMWSIHCTSLLFICLDLMKSWWSLEWTWLHLIFLCRFCSASLTVPVMQEIIYSEKKKAFSAEEHCTHISNEEYNVSFRHRSLESHKEDYRGQKQSSEQTLINDTAKECPRIQAAV